MKTALLKGLDERQKDEMRQAFAASAFVRQQLIKLAAEKIESTRTANRSKTAYETPNWAYLQADAVGYERALVEMISLLTHDNSARDGEPIGETPESRPKRRGRPPKVRVPE